MKSLIVIIKLFAIENKNKHKINDENPFKLFIQSIFCTMVLIIFD